MSDQPVRVVQKTEACSLCPDDSVLRGRAAILGKKSAQAALVGRDDMIEQFARTASAELTRKVSAVSSATAVYLAEGKRGAGL